MNRKRTAALAILSLFVIVGCELVADFDRTQITEGVPGLDASNDLTLRDDSTVSPDSSDQDGTIPTPDGSTSDVVTDTGPDTQPPKDTGVDTGKDTGPDVVDAGADADADAT